MQLAGQRVLLTGASGGIGLAIARALHARGATVIATARREEVLERARRRARRPGRDASWPTSRRPTTWRRCPRRAGRVDVLVANAALPASGALLDFEPGHIDRALDVNLRAPTQLARALAPAMVERGSGHLVFISSLSGKAANAGSSLYSATKFGMRGMALGLHGDLHGTGVGVTTVFPGFIRDAGMFHDSGTELPRGVGTRTPDQVAAAVVKGDRARPDGGRRGAAVGADGREAGGRGPGRLGEAPAADGRRRGRRGPGQGPGRQALATGPARRPRAQPWPLMWSSTVLNSSVGEKSTYSVSSRASGACPGAQ